MAAKKKTAAAGNDRQNALDAAMAMIEKDFGKGAIMRLKSARRFSPSPRATLPSTLHWALAAGHAGA